MRAYAFTGGSLSNYYQQFDDSYTRAYTRYNTREVTNDFLKFSVSFTRRTDKSINYCFY